MVADGQVRGSSTTESDRLDAHRFCGAKGMSGDGFNSAGRSTWEIQAVLASAQALVLCVKKEGNSLLPTMSRGKLRKYGNAAQCAFLIFCNEVSSMLLISEEVNV